MPIIRTVLEDNHSGESAWEGEMLTLFVPDNVYAEMKAGTSVMFMGEFINLVWNDGALPMLDDAMACDAVIESWVSTEPSKSELSEYPWKHMNFRDDFTFDPNTWMIRDQSGNESVVYHVD